MRFQTPRLHIGLVWFHQKMDTRMFQFLGAVLELMEGNFQTRGQTTLEGLELCSTNRMVYLFWIWPYEIQVRSLHLTNSFMYRNETITAAYEGAGWAFPTETYCFSPPLRVHHQGFEIIRRAHFPPTLVSSQILESSLELNWLPSMDATADEWDLKEWAFGTVKRTRLLILPSSNNCLTKTPLQVRAISRWVWRHLWRTYRETRRWRNQNAERENIEQSSLVYVWWWLQQED